MNSILFAVSAVIAYLIGGINPAILLSKAIYHQDIRQCGSGNPGFTNFKRVYGSKWAWFVFALDLGKSALLAAVCAALFGHYAGMRQLGAAWAGFFAMLGHVFPVWYCLKGGKGFSVGAAAIFFVDWRTGLIAAAIMAATLFTLHYMSLSVICAAISCPITLALFGADTLWTVLLCTLGVLLLIWRHKGNIRRLLDGTEPKFSFRDSGSQPTCARTAEK